MCQEEIFCDNPGIQNLVPLLDRLPSREAESCLVQVERTPDGSCVCRTDGDAAADYSTFLDIPSSEWIEGKVVSMMDYGAFVRLPQGVDGMVHISQMGSQGQRVGSVYEELQVRWRTLAQALGVLIPSVHAGGVLNQNSSFQLLSTFVLDASAEI